MKTLFPSIRNLIALAVFGSASAFGLWPGTVSAQIIANFDAGNTSEEVDGDPGRAGNGWKSEWYTSPQNFDTTLSREVKNSGPLTGGSGNYLSIEMTNNERSTTANRTVAFGRHYEDYGVVSLNASHTISFLHRVNTPAEGTPVAMPGIFDSATEHPHTPNQSTSFYLRVVSGNWYYYTSSDTRFDTGIPLIYGDTYEFTIQVDPGTKEWAFSIINLDNEELSFYMASLAFYGSGFYGESPRDSVGGNLRWNMTLADRRSDDAPLRAVTYDIDSVLIIPEPGVSVLFLGAGVLLLAGRWTASRSK